MINVQKAIFPGMTLGCIFLVVFANLIANPQVALASNPPAAVAAGLGVQIGDGPVLPAASAREDQSQENGSQVAGVGAVEEPVSAEASSPPVEAPAAEPAQCSLSLNYPGAIQQWCPLIERYSGEFGLEPSLIAAVMLQESGGNPDAYSKSGAVGLMQVMPRDGLAASFMCINGPCFSSRPSMDELFDPEFNVAYGVRMLAGLIQRHGSIREALRAYGPMNTGYHYADLVLSIQERYR